MKLLNEESVKGRSLSLIGKCDVEEYIPYSRFLRDEVPELPQVSEVTLSRHFSALERRSHGVNNGFYPLGSCTMKYNPAVDEEIAAFEGFTGAHPLQDDSEVQGSLQVIKDLEDRLSAITGMDAFTLQPAAGAHGEFTGLLMIKAYLESIGETERNKIIVPDSAHGTNPASAAMAGFNIVNVPSGPDGCVDLEALRQAVGSDVAGLMLTNPNTVGLFDKNILEITRIIHEAGGLCYYDGANLNAVMGIVRPGDMGFDVMHLNLHKTFAAPHGGGGPGSGPVGCKEFLAEFLPGSHVEEKDGALVRVRPAKSIGDMRSFDGNFLVAVKALSYIWMLGAEGVKEASQNAVLNANYMRVKLSDIYTPAYDTTCMHEFVLNLQKLKAETGCSALDAAKGLIDYGIHPPTMYFPLIVHEALMIEPTETETKETLDEAINALREIYDKAYNDPEYLKEAPHSTVIGRPDEVAAARHPIVHW
ncbi:MAG: aminomethyl-transferring glycine dehydrogenase subunit GcvPB [Lachnospiraceae bacterium]|nr:aminomethyl-transferring glycine dehydrogenase subunit GcvPB [Lachnospiraceae bacterium]